MAEKEKSLGMLANLRKLNGFVTVLVLTFATASWIGYQVVLVELPIFVSVLPEEWALPSHITVAVVISYVGTCIYLLAGKLCPAKDPRKRESYTGILLICTDITALIFLVVFWDSTAFVFGAERSVALLLLIFFLSMADCCSFVVFCPFMTRFPSRYMGVYFTGETLGGLVAGIVGLAQGVAGEGTCSNQTHFNYNATTGLNISVTSVMLTPSIPRFSPSSFFGFVVAMLFITLVAYLLLNFASVGKNEMIEKSSNGQGEEVAVAERVIYDGNRCDTNDDNPSVTIRHSSKARIATLIMLYSYPCLSVYGVCGSLLPYATLPYGSIAYTLAVRLGSIISPLTCLIPYILPTRSLKILLTTCAVSTLITIYIVYLAAMSPHPPLADHPAGMVLVIAAYLGLFVLNIYAKVSAGTALHLEAGHFGVQLAGACSLAVYAVVTITCFILINVYHLFHQKQPCKLRLLVNEY